MVVDGYQDLQHPGYLRRGKESRGERKEEVERERERDKAWDHPTPSGS